MTHDVINVIAVLGIAGQVLFGILLLAVLLAALGSDGPLETIRDWLWGYELWAAFVVSAIATGGSLFWRPAAMIAWAPRMESGPRTATGRASILSFPLLT